MGWYALSARTIAIKLHLYQQPTEQRSLICLSFRFNFGVLINAIHTHTLTHTEICDTDLNRKISLCQELLEVAGILEPGCGIFRGKLLVDMQEALFVQTERQFSHREISSVVAKVRVVGLILI